MSQCGPYDPLESFKLQKGQRDRLLVKGSNWGHEAVKTYTRYFRVNDKLQKKAYLKLVLKLTPDITGKLYTTPGLIKLPF